MLSERPFKLANQKAERGKILNPEYNMFRDQPIPGASPLRINTLLSGRIPNHSTLISGLRLIRRLSEHFNGRFLRHRFSLKPRNAATRNSLPKRNHVAKEAVSAAWETRSRQRSERICKPNDAPRTKPRPSVKTMLSDSEAVNAFYLRTRSRASTEVPTREQVSRKVCSSTRFMR